MDKWKVLECSVCGGSLEKLSETAYKCKYCGSMLEQDTTLPDDVTHNLFAAAHYRRTYEFAKAGDAYKAVLEKKRDVCEANWGAFLCRYGVNYVESHDGRFHPTFWRVDHKSVYDNPEYKFAVSLCGEASKPDYMSRGQEIEDLRARLISRMQEDCNAEIYLCARRMQADGGRETYAAEKQNCDAIFAFLTAEGYRVFYEPKSLNDVDFDAEEPEIFSAINQCKMMLVADLSDEGSAWVRDKYMRFKALAQAGSGKSIGVITLSGVICSPFLAGCNAYNASKPAWEQAVLRDAEKVLGARESIAKKAARLAAEAEQKKREKQLQEQTEKQKAASEKEVAATSVSGGGGILSGFGGSFSRASGTQEKVASGAAFSGASMSGGLGAKRIMDGAVSTDPKALREIAKTVRSYCLAQSQTLDGYLYNIRSLTKDWDDEGYRQLLAAAAGVRSKMANQLPRMESFARWLEQKADVLEKSPR